MAGLLIVLAAIATVETQDSVPLSRFEGTWVGLQSWTVENPSAEEPQPVTLTLAMDDGKLTGSMRPFLGLAAGVSITEARVVGDELHATAAPGRGLSWQRSVGVRFRLTRDADAMTGTADLAFGDLDWLKFDYTLNRKRSRYGPGN